MTRKLIIHDGHTQRELLLVGTIVVGRDPSCHITDLDPLLSRRHAEFVTTADDVTVRDLGSRNGMLVNGEKVEEHVLVPGDLVQLGHLQLRYVERHTVYTPEAKVISHATTASGMGGAIRAAAAAANAKPAKPGAELEDTQPHPPHVHAAPVHDPDVTRALDPDAEITRAPGQREPDATFVAGASDADATVAPVRKGTAAPESGDSDPTRVPGVRVSADADATVAPSSKTGADVDATFVPGVKRADVDPDRTFAPGASLDATFVAAGPGFDATFVPGINPAIAAMDAAAAGSDAQLVAGRDLRVVAASDSCRAVFGAGPDALVGQALGDLLARSLQSVAAGSGPAALSFVVARSPSDRTLTLTIKAVQPVGTVS